MLQGCGFRDRIRDFELRGVKVLGASFDSVEDNAAFARRYDFPYPLLCDVDRRVGLAYGACASLDAKYPARITYLVGSDGRIELALETPDPAAQAAEILDYLTEAAV